MKRIGWMLLPALVLLACATWVPVGGVTKERSLGIEVDLPPGWMRLRTGNGIVITRDGLGLDYIRIQRSDVDEELPNVNRSIRAGMLTQEVAELSLDSARLERGITNFEIEENSPARIDGRECYKLVYSFRVESGLKLRTMKYGCVIAEHHYNIEYRAAAQHYFDANLDSFEAVRDSIRFTS